MNEIAKYWHTLRYLRPIQFWGRFIQLTARPPIPRSAPFSIRPGFGFHTRPVLRRQSMYGADSFEFLNERRTPSAQDFWADAEASLLWNYNLHYFDDLNSRDAGARRHWHKDLIRSWIEHNPPGSRPGWDAYPTSLRIVNWIKYASGKNFLDAATRSSLSNQVRWLNRRLEWHLLGNHLFANAKALIFAGAFFDGTEADHLRKRGESILLRELGEQILADGGHFERSPMYHAIILEDILDLLNLECGGKRILSPQLEAILVDAARRMGSTLGVLTHPDGEIAYFNDAAIGIASSPCDLQTFAVNLGVEAKCGTAVTGASKPALSYRALEDTGYGRLESRDAVVLIDVAPVGPDYLPGHAHADTLSFELSLFGRRVIVNGGTSRYGSTRIRLEERQTDAHSTVVIDGMDSSEVWGAFRVARRAYPIGLASHVGDDRIVVKCGHDGYRRLVGSPVHYRQWDMAARHLVIEDMVAPPKGHQATAKFNLHPSTSCRQSGTDCFEVLLDNGKVIQLTILKGVAKLAPGFYGAEFGRRMPIRSICVDLVEGCSRVKIDW